MRAWSCRAARWSVSLLLGLGLATACRTETTKQTPSGTRRDASVGATLPSESVTPASGKSWIGRLGILYHETRIGKTGGGGPPPRSERREPPRAVILPARGFRAATVRQLRWLFDGEPRGDDARPVFVLTGADLYRLNCQSCHGPDGAGSPPEINSLIDAVRGASPLLLRRRVESSGQPVDQAFVDRLASEGEKALRERLTHGGTKMPPFNHLNEEEADALLNYIRQLAGVPGAGRGAPVTLTVERVGEQLTKGTCHLCHDATSTESDRAGRAPIAPLADVIREQSADEVIEKVLGTSGPPDPELTDPMPALAYLTEEEVAAVYVSLSANPRIR